MPNGHHRQANQRRGQYNQDRPRIPAPDIKSDAIKKWVKEGIDSGAVDFCEKVAEYLKNRGLTNSQIRNIYGEIMRIYMKGADKEKTALLLLKPKIAYMRAKAGNNPKGLDFIEQLYNTIYNVLDKDNNENLSHQFENVLYIMEAILAYHKAKGGRD